MFRKSSPSVPEGTPDVALDPGAVQRWYALYGQPVNESKRYWLLLVIALVIIVLLVLAIWSLFPLKEKVPYMVSESAQGELRAMPVQVEKFTPEERHKRAMVRNYVTWLMDVDTEKLVTQNLAKAWNVSRESAIGQFQAHFNKFQWIKLVHEDPGFTQKVEINTVASLDNKVYLVRFQTKRIASGAPHAEVRKWQATVHHKVQPPLDIDQEPDNPAGIYITQFTIQEERL